MVARACPPAARLSGVRREEVLYRSASALFDLCSAAFVEKGWSEPVPVGADASAPIVEEPHMLEAPTYITDPEEQAAADAADNAARHNLSPVVRGAITAGDKAVGR